MILWGGWMSKNKGYHLQTDAQNNMDLLYLEYNGERVPDIQFVYSASNIHELEELIDLLDKKDAECNVLDNHIDFLHNMNTMLDRQITRQAKHLEKIYKLIKNKDWDGLTALYMDTYQDYGEIV